MTFQSYLFAEGTYTALEFYIYPKIKSNLNLLQGVTPKTHLCLKVIGYHAKKYIQL